MGFQLGNKYLQELIDRGILPDNTVEATIRIRVDEVPSMDYTVLLDGEDTETITGLISTVEEVNGK